MGKEAVVKVWRMAGKSCAPVSRDLHSQISEGAHILVRRLSAENNSHSLISFAT